MRQFVLLVIVGCVARVLALELAAWRGETVSSWLPSGEVVGSAPDGLTVTVGVAREVAYAPQPHAETRHVVTDRVEWNSTATGLRVVQVKVSAQAKPGIYSCGDVTVKVVDRVLPPASDWKYYLNLWQHPWAVARMARVAPFTKAHYDAMRPLWRMLAAAGQKSLTLTLVEQPWNHQCFDAYRPMVGYVRRADGTTDVDWTIFDAYVEFGRSCGIGPNLDLFTMCPWGYKVSWLDETGELVRAEAKPGTSFFREYWRPLLKSLAAHLREKGWFDQTYISLDERTPEDLRNTAEFIQEVAPGLRIAMAGNRKPSDYKGITVDAYSLGMRYITPEFLSEASPRRAQGRITTFYICCSPNTPNTFMSSELDEAFWVGAYPAMCGLDGLLRWAYNSWPKDACQDATYSPSFSKGGWASGDTFLIYPDGSPSMRFLALVDGIQQAEKFNILKAAGVRVDELAALASRYSLKGALEKKPGDFGNLVQETRMILNK